MRITKRNCPLCNSANKQSALNIDAKSFCDVNFAYIKNPYELLGITSDTKFSFVKCRDCDFMFSEDLLDENSLHIVYEKIINPLICKEYSLSEKVFEENSTNFDKAISCFTNTDLVRKSLDFGAGWGTWAIIASKRINDVYCYETSPIRKRHISNAGLKLLDSESDISKNCNFDLINCHQVLEHVPNPRETLNKLCKSLSSIGGIWLTVPHCDENYFVGQKHAISKGKNAKGLNPWEHLNYFTPESLLTMCKMEGLVPHNNFLDEHENIRTTECLFVKEPNFSLRKFLISKLKQAIPTTKMPR